MGRLSIVATPIGNLEDITLRALRVLKECGRILAEDTRRTRVLCEHHGVATPLKSFHAHTTDERLHSLVDELREGAHLALVTDAGTPLVSDPGARLVAAAVAAGIDVEPIPGASAPLAALTASGLRVGRFRFVGFLPRSGRERREALARVVTDRDASVLFESPKRLPTTLRDLAALAPERPAAVCRELTKLNEEVARDRLQGLAERFAAAPRGEITVVIEGAPEVTVPFDPGLANERARQLLDEGMRTKEAARRLAVELGVGVREAYAIVLSVTS